VPDVVHARCHVGAPVEVSYLHGSGVLRIGCKKCGRQVAMIAVQSEVKS
jgi:hypothetical protein